MNQDQTPTKPQTEAPVINSVAPGQSQAQAQTEPKPQPASEAKPITVPAVDKA